MIVNQLDSGIVSKLGLNSVANVTKQKSNVIPYYVSETKVTSGAAASALTAVGLYITTKGKNSAGVKSTIIDVLQKIKGKVCYFIKDATQNVKSNAKSNVKSNVKLNVKFNVTSRAENTVSSNVKPGINTAKNVITDLRTPKTDRIQTLMSKFWLPNKVKSRILDFEQELEMVTDPKIKSYVTAKLDEILKPNYNNAKVLKDLNEIEMLTDASNESARHYTKIYDNTIIGALSRPTNIMEFEKFMKRGNSSITEVLSGNVLPNYLEKGKNSLKGDLASEGLFYSTRQYIKNYSKNEISDYLYSNYLSLMKNCPEEVLKYLRSINDKYNVKIFIPTRFSRKSFTEVMDYIDNELGQWVKASEGKAKLPPVIDFSAAKTSWYDTFAAHGQSVASAYSECGTRALAFSQLDKTTVSWALRHEMTHSNDLNLGKNIPTKYNLNEIMPKKIIERNGRKVSVPDLENCKYTEEFIKGKPDISDRHLRYAYNNTKEFIAIASEGDMSKYSPEFKQMLIDFGMPDWMFKMAPKQ